MHGPYAVHCNTLKHCNALQHTMHLKTFPPPLFFACKKEHSNVQALRLATMWYVATNCNTLQHTLQRTEMFFPLAKLWHVRMTRTLTGVHTYRKYIYEKITFEDSHVHIHRMTGTSHVYIHMEENDFLPPFAGVKFLYDNPDAQIDSYLRRIGQFFSRNLPRVKMTVTLTCVWIYSKNDFFFPPLRDLWRVRCSKWQLLATCRVFPPHNLWCVKMTVTLTYVYIYRKKLICSP